MTRKYLFFILGSFAPMFFDLCTGKLFSGVISGAQMGSYAEFMAFILIGVIVLYAWLAAPILRWLPNAAPEQTSFFKQLVCDYIALLHAVLLALTGAVWLLKGNDSAWHFFLTFSGSVTSIAYALLVYLLLGMDRGHLYAAAQGIIGVIKISIGWLLVLYWSRTAESVVLGALVGRLAVMAWLLVIVKLPRPSFALPNLTQFRKVVAFGLPLSIAQAALTLPTLWDRFFIKAGPGLAAAGAFVAICVVCNGLALAAAQSILFHNNARFTRLWADGKRAEVANICFKITLKWLCFGIVLTGALWPVRQTVVGYLYHNPPPWAGDVLTLSIIAFWITQGGLILQRPIELAAQIWPVMTVCIVTATLNVAIAWPLVARFGALGMSGAQAIAYTLQITLTALVLWRLQKGWHHEHSCPD